MSASAHGMWEYIPENMPHRVRGIHRPVVFVVGTVYRRTDWWERAEMLKTMGALIVPQEPMWFGWDPGREWRLMTRAEIVFRQEYVQGPRPNGVWFDEVAP